MALMKTKGGHELYYECHGEPHSTGRPPLLLLSGMAGSCAGWLPLQMPHFSAERPVVIFDHRGVGPSEDDGEAFSTADLAKDAKSLIDHLGIEKIDVLGAFMGGMTAQELALAAPDRIRKLVLVGTYARPDNKRLMLLKHWAQLVQIGLSEETFIYNRLLWTLHDDTIDQDDLIQAMTNFYRNENAPVSADLFVRQCQACEKHDATDRLGNLPHSTLILCGRNDILTPPKFHRELADLIPQSRLVTMSYGGHLVMVESAKQFNQTVSQFLDEEA
ncbi:MAG: alpha/beta fold hydrolase [Myxococcota bacterium]